MLIASSQAAVFDWMSSAGQLPPVTTLLELPLAERHSSAGQDRHLLRSIGAD